MANRPLWMIAVLLLGTAAALWGATEVAWTETAHGTGGPSFAALALLALASLAGVFAVSGLARRGLGAIIAVAGGYVVWQAVDHAGGLVGGRGLGFLGGVLFVAAGVLILVYAPALPTIGAKYELANAERRSGDPEKDMWDGLSDGEDPTADEPRT
jgi:hypothetical protein